MLHSKIKHALTKNIYTSAFPKRDYQKVLTSLSSSLVETKLITRGRIPKRGEEIMNDIEAGHGNKYMFSRV